MGVRGKRRFIQTRRAIGAILNEAREPMSPQEIAEALRYRPTRAITATPNRVSQLLRGARGIVSDKEMRDFDSSRQQSKVYSMDEYDLYEDWLDRE
tara:strand:+ start:9993 stop:10280 length:288 start_codon:yes stop_codon:yes gene_type:complete